MSNRDPYYDDKPGTDPFTTTGSGQVGDTTRNTTDKAKAKGQEAMNEASQKGKQAKQQASKAADKAEAKADMGMDKAASGLDEAADTLREKGGQQGGSMGSTATMVADKMDSASMYLREHDTDQLVDDVESFIRSKPTESLLIAAGVGFVLSKLFR